MEPSLGLFASCALIMVIGAEIFTHYKVVRAAAVYSLCHSLLSPDVLPVFGLTRCTDPHARQVTPTKTSSASSDSPSSPANPCTRNPVFGQRKMNGGIRPFSAPS
jgi:hypothetical protein